MSDHAPADRDAVRELGSLVHHLADELAAFRRRALVAEARLKDLDGHNGSAINLDLAGRVAHLERENENLASKVEAAGTRAKAMLDRVRFLRQQTQGAQK
jgi:hypothetical protein